MSVAQQINKLIDLREEIKEDSIYEDIDLEELVRMLVRGQNIRKILGDAVMGFNSRHSGIFKKAAEVGVVIGRENL